MRPDHWPISPLTLYFSLHFFLLLCVCPWADVLCVPGCGVISFVLFLMCACGSCRVLMKLLATVKCFEQQQKWKPLSVALALPAACHRVGALCGSRVEEGAPETSSEFAFFPVLLFVLLRLGFDIIGLVIAIERRWGRGGAACLMVLCSACLM